MSKNIKKKQFGRQIFDSHKRARLAVACAAMRGSPPENGTERAEKEHVRPKNGTG